MSKPRAVLISDIHFTPATLELASKALIQAKDTAYRLKVPLIIAGDTLDTKALMRAEVVNRLIEILSDQSYSESIYVLVGNHDLLNEKGKAHSLEFLKPHCRVVQSVVQDVSSGLWMIPYHNDSAELKGVLNDIPASSTLIMHQGVLGAAMGHYVQDKTSLSPEAFANFRVISGHYHKSQDITCGPMHGASIGLFSYIGTPYTISFAEANDGSKGFKILYHNGHLEHVDTDLRRHMIFNRTTSELSSMMSRPDPFLQKLVNKADRLTLEDLIWVKVTGPYSELKKLNKTVIGNHLLGHNNFKLDLIPTDSAPLEPKREDVTPDTILDTLIDNTTEDSETKEYLKELWREVLA